MNESQHQIARSRAKSLLADGRWTHNHYNEDEMEDIVTRVILSAIERATALQTTILGFTSWKDGRFELIVRDEESHEETTLKGTLEPGQFEQVSKILPTCVMIKATAQPQKEDDATCQTS